MSEEANEVQVAKEEATTVSQPKEGKIFWNDREMNSSYANVANVATTSDEIMFLFGTSEAWNSAQKDVHVNLKQRVIMTPATAKRFQALLNKTLDEFDKRTES